MHKWCNYDDNQIIAWSNIEFDNPSQRALELSWDFCCCIFNTRWILKCSWSILRQYSRHISCRRARRLCDIVMIKLRFLSFRFRSKHSTEKTFHVVNFITFYGISWIPFTRSTRQFPERSIGERWRKTWRRFRLFRRRFGVIWQVSAAVKIFTKIFNDVTSLILGRFGWFFRLNRLKFDPLSF